MLAAAKRPSEMRVGSQSSHCSLGSATVLVPDSRKTFKFINRQEIESGGMNYSNFSAIYYLYSYSVQVQNLNTSGNQNLLTLLNLIIFCVRSKFY